MTSKDFSQRTLTDIKVKLDAEFLRKISLVKPFLMKNGKISLIFFLLAFALQN